MFKGQFKIPKASINAAPLLGLLQFSAILMKISEYILFEKNFCTEITYKRHQGTFRNHIYRFYTGELLMF